MARVVESLKRLPIGGKIELNSSLEETVSHGQHYILFVCGTQSEQEFRIATALSDYSCVIYSVGESLNQTITLDHNQAPIVGIKFSSTSKNILYIATNNGIITACDLRAKGKIVSEFKDNTENGKTKPLASFDLSCDERLIAGGTEHIGGDTFILFWDVRQSGSKIGNKNTLLGGYWESHMDDVTCLAFHPDKRNVLVSGSTDGLMNIFDLTQSSEDLALTASLNTESSVDRVGWTSSDSLWCTTHTHNLQLWENTIRLWEEYEDAYAYKTFTRDHLAVLQNDDPDNFYLVRYHDTKVFGPFLLAGSSTVKGENLRGFDMRNKQETYYEMLENKQIVRDSWMHEKSGSLVTVGEKGIINVWQSTLGQNSGHKFLMKIGTGREPSHRLKPYPTIHSRP